MTIEYRHLCDRPALVSALRDALRQHHEAHPTASGVVLSDSLISARSLRASVADLPEAFGVEFSTAQAWSDDLWDLIGDGRVPVSSNERQMVILSLLLKDTAGFVGPVQPGLVALLADLASSAAHFLSSSAVRNRGIAIESLPVADARVIAFMDAYLEELSVRGRCESTTMRAALTDSAALGHIALPPMIAAFSSDPPFPLCDFIEGYARVSDVVVLVDEGKGATLPPDKSRNPEIQAILDRLFVPHADPVCPSGAVTFRFPSGYTALHRSITEEVKTLVDDGSLTIAVGVVDVEETLCACAEPLCAAGLGLEAHMSVPFSSTLLGRAMIPFIPFLALDDTTYVSGRTDAASAFASSIFSRFSSAHAAQLDGKWRGNRLVTVDDCLNDLRSGSAFCEACIPSLKAGEWSAFCDLVEGDLVSRSDLDPALLSRERSALALFRGWCGAAQQLLLPLTLLLESFADTTVACSRAYRPKDTPRASVTFTTTGNLAQCDPLSFDAVVLCDLDAGRRPIRDKVDDAARILEETGLGTAESSLAVSRRELLRSLSCAIERIVCIRSLTEWDTDEAFPSVFFEEIVDTYRVDSTADDLDGKLALPPALLPFARRYSESDLFENASSGTARRDPLENVVHRDFSDLSPASRDLVTLSRRDSQNRPIDGTALSPSQIESYLQCPCLWLAQRRFRLDELDADMGAAEMGSFSHSVLCSFYRHFTDPDQYAQVKVTDENIEQARALLNDVFARHLQAQYDPSRRNGGGNPMVPLGSFQTEQVETLRTQLLAYLDFERTLLPGFTPYRFEQNFGGEGDPYVYAGCYLNGSIDRIDVDMSDPDHPKAVIIDYKGSLSDDYRADQHSPLFFQALSDNEAEGEEEDEPFELPNKMQSLIYAKYVRDVLGFRVVGALYVSYGKKLGVSGVYDDTVLGSEDIPLCPPAHCAYSKVSSLSFDEYLDCAEAEVTAALEYLKQGFVSAHPRYAAACSYCPVTDCVERES